MTVYSMSEFAKSDGHGLCATQYPLQDQQTIEEFRDGAISCPTLSVVVQLDELEVGTPECETPHSLEKEQGPSTEHDLEKEQVPGTETKRERLEREFNALKPFAIISCTYLLYTVTDGAIRTIVLLHAFNLNFSAWETAILFTLYELAGVFTNLIAGAAGARWGIKQTLICGLVLQLGGIGMLFGWQGTWKKSTSMAYVTLAQMLCGISKDLVKLGGKTVTKLVTKEEQQSRLFKIVSLLTGWKNTLKGVGYFIGSALLTVHYFAALGVMCGLIFGALPLAVFGLSSSLGRTRKENVNLKTIFRQKYNVNVLSVARFFLFGSRDLWFEVPLPFFLRSSQGLGWERAAVGAFLAGWIILYGQIQSWSPTLILKPFKQSPANKWVCSLWGIILICCPTFLALFFQFAKQDPVSTTTGVLTFGVSVFAFVFAINSAVHSYLIVKYSEGDKVAMNVGFYYMANALGRLTGTIVSGALYEFVGQSTSRFQGFAACFWVSVAFVVAAAGTALLLNDNSGGLSCGSLCNCFSEESKEEGQVETVDNVDIVDPVDKPSTISTMSTWSTVSN